MSRCTQSRIKIVLHFVQLIGLIKQFKLKFSFFLIKIKQFTIITEKPYESGFSRTSGNAGREVRQSDSGI